MPGQEQESDKPKTTKRKKKRVWLAAIILVIAVIFCLLLWDLLKSKSINEQLAAIEAARAIPDSENAATIYNQLLEDYNEAAFSPAFLDPNTDDLTRMELWSSEDYPEIAAWVKQQQGTITTLLEASKKKDCRFPITGYPETFPERVDRLAPMRKWAYFLVRAANNDLAEGRIEAAIDKLFCLFQMGRHQQQQPVAVDCLYGLAIESLASDRTCWVIVEGPCTEEHLKTIEARLPPTTNDWNSYSRTMFEVERLYEKKERNFFRQIRYLWQDVTETAEFKRMHEIYLRLPSDRRGIRILIALRRYRNKTGHWPERLDQIKSSLPPEALIDPFNDGPFLYRLTGSGFELYSTGKNKLDENGKHRDPFDDWPIWPPHGRKPKTEKEENTNGK